jgi:hypothetical protein
MTMPRPGWTYIRVDDQLPDDDKLDGLTISRRVQLVGSLIEAWCYANRHLTDGFISDKTWTKIGTDTGRNLMLERGFADQVPDGYLMRNYLRHQRSRADVEQISQTARRNASRRWGTDANRNATGNANRNADRNAEQSRTSRPTPPWHPSNANRIAEHLPANRSLADAQHYAGVNGPPLDPDTSARLAAEARATLTRARQVADQARLLKPPDPDVPF